MTKLLEHAIAAMRELSSEKQDSLARILLQFAGEDFRQADHEGEDASFDMSLAQADRGEFASDDEVRAIWAKHGL